MTLSKKNILYIFLALIILLPILFIIFSSIIKNEINHKLAQVEINIPKLTRKDVLEAFDINLDNHNKTKKDKKQHKIKKDLTDVSDSAKPSKKEKQLENILRNAEEEKSQNNKILRKIEGTPQQKPISAEEEIDLLETSSINLNESVSKEDKTKIRQIIEGDIEPKNINNYIPYPVDYGKTKFRNPADLSPEEYRAFKFGYPADMTLADYVNWLWMFREEDYSLTLDHATNLQKLKVGIKLEKVKGECPPQSRVYPPLRSTSYFNKLYNNQGQLNIAPPLNSTTDALLGHNFADYVDFQQNMDLYGASGQVVNPELYKKIPAKLLDWWLKPVNESTVNRNQTAIHEIIKKKNDTYFNPVKGEKCV